MQASFRRGNVSTNSRRRACLTLLWLKLSLTDSPGPTGRAVAAHPAGPLPRIQGAWDSKLRPLPLCLDPCLELRRLPAFRLCITSKACLALPSCTRHASGAVRLPFRAAATNVSTASQRTPSARQPGRPPPRSGRRPRDTRHPIRRSTRDQRLAPAGTATAGHGSVAASSGRSPCVAAAAVARSPRDRPLAVQAVAPGDQACKS
jgi:hypothetical protein